MGTTDSTSVEQRPNEPSLLQLWCVAATIVASRPGETVEQATQSGTKHFKPEAKIYVLDWAPGDREHLVVIGHHRKSRQFLKAVVSVAWVEHLSLEQVSIPTVTALANKHAVSSGVQFTQEHAEAMLSAILVQQAP